MLIFQCHFDGLPFEVMGPLLGPLKSTAFLKPMAPSWAPGSLYSPATHLGGPGDLAQAGASKVHCFLQYFRGKE